MFYDDINKLEVIEKTVCDNLSSADCLNDTHDPRELRKQWVNYRTDMALMVGVLREYKELIIKLKELEKVQGEANEH